MQSQAYSPLLWLLEGRTGEGFSLSRPQRARDESHHL